MKKFNWLRETFTSQDTNIPTQKNGNGRVFINTGAIAVFINGYPLNPGATLSLLGNVNEIDETIYSLSWAAGAGSQIMCFTKIYK